MQNLEDKIVKSLETLKAIEPRAEFAHISKMAILSAPKPAFDFRMLRKSFWDHFRMGLGLMAASFIALLVIGTVVRWQQAENRAGLNDGKLLSEAKNFDVDIRLKEAKYFEESAEEVAVALQKISNLPEREHSIAP
jgi:hypothetical protein